MGIFTWIDFVLIAKFTFQNGVNSKWEILFTDNLTSQMFNANWARHHFSLAVWQASLAVSLLISFFCMNTAWLLYWTHTHLHVGVVFGFICNVWEGKNMRQWQHNEYDEIHRRKEYVMFQNQWLLVTLFFFFNLLLKCKIFYFWVTTYHLWFTVMHVSVESA